MEVVSPMKVVELGTPEELSPTQTIEKEDIDHSSSISGTHPFFADLQPLPPKMNHFMTKYCPA